MTDTRGSTPILLPSFGATIEEGTIVSWKVSVGDTVRAGQIIAEIETDKALVELEATDDGVIEAIEVAEDSEPVNVGTTIARLTKTDVEPNPGSGTIDSTPAPGTTFQGAAESTPAVAQNASQPTDRPNDEPTSHKNGQTDSGDARPSRIHASPRARRMARESGLDVHEIPGSGPDGRIVGRDLESTPVGTVQPPFGPGRSPIREASATTTSPSLSDLGFTPGSYDLIPLTGMRRAIARRLTESFRDIPHYSLSVDVELDGVIRHRKKINESRKEGAVSISINDFVIWSAAAALKDVPEANASYTEEGIALHRHADIAVAVAIGGGLVTPVVRAAETKSLHEIAAEIRQLAERARARKLGKAEFEGGTFTVSNLGMVGITSFTSVLNPPQGCILSVGAAEQRPIVRNGENAIATMATMTLTCDHRVVDGVVGAEFLSSFKSHLITPTPTASG